MRNTEREDRLSIEVCRLQGENEELKKKLISVEAARYAYASEFSPGVNEEPDVGSIHENIRKLKRVQEIYRAQVLEWIEANAPGGWVDNLRKELERVNGLARMRVLRNAVSENQKLLRQMRHARGYLRYLKNLLKFLKDEGRTLVEIKKLSTSLSLALDALKKQKEEDHG